MSARILICTLLVLSGCEATEPGPTQDDLAGADASLPELAPTDAEPALDVYPDATVPDLAFADALVDIGVDTGVDTSSACGVPRTATSSRCSGLTDCGRGQRNLLSVRNCDNCLQFAESHICDDGMCRTWDDPPAQVAFRVPALAADAYGFTVASLNPIAADGTVLRCAELMTTCPLEGNGKLNVVRSAAAGFPNNQPALGNTDYFLTIPMEPGADRILIVRAVENANGSGAVYAEGCADGLAVPARADGPAQFSMELTRVP